MIFTFINIYTRVGSMFPTHARNMFPTEVQENFLQIWCWGFCIASHAMRRKLSYKVHNNLTNLTTFLAIMDMYEKVGMCRTLFCISSIMNAKHTYVPGNVQENFLNICTVGSCIDGSTCTHKTKNLEMCSKVSYSFPVHTYLENDPHFITVRKLPSFHTVNCSKCTHIALHLVQESFLHWSYCISMHYVIF